MKHMTKKIYGCLFSFYKRIREKSGRVIRLPRDFIVRLQADRLSVSVSFYGGAATGILGMIVIPSMIEMDFCGENNRCEVHPVLSLLQEKIVSDVCSLLLLTGKTASLRTSFYTQVWKDELSAIMLSYREHPELYNVHARSKVYLSKM